MPKEIEFLKKLQAREGPKYSGGMSSDSQCRCGGGSCGCSMGCAGRNDEPRVLMAYLELF